MSPAALVFISLLCIFGYTKGRDCNSAHLNITLHDDSTNPSDNVNLFAVVCLLLVYTKYLLFVRN